MEFWANKDDFKHGAVKVRVEPLLKILRISAALWFAGVVQPLTAVEGHSVVGDAPVFNTLGGPPTSAACGRAFALLLGGAEKQAFEAFQKLVVEAPSEAPAHFGLGLHYRLRGEYQKANEEFTLALSAGRQDPWADIYLDYATQSLPLCHDSGPLLKLLHEMENDDKVNPHLRDRVRRVGAEWLLMRGQYKEAQLAFDPLQYIGLWQLIGPFDNRDGAGMAQASAPEEEIDLDNPVPGRNRKVSWFAPDRKSIDGKVDLSSIFEPQTHVLAYALTQVNLEQAQWCVLRIGCGGAVRVWVNDREVATVKEYNDFADAKRAIPVYLHNGPNQILVKSGVIEDTEWAFSVRLSKPEGGPLPGLVVNTGKDAQAAYKKTGAGRRSPLLEPKSPDLGVIIRLEKALKAAPKDALVRAFYGLQLDLQRLGSKEDRIAAREYSTAIEQCPKCPLFRIMLAESGEDVNQSRMAAEKCLADHPDLASAYEALAELAYNSGLGLTAERYARTAVTKFGIRSSGRAALYLGYVLDDRGHKAEAYRVIHEFAEAHPYLPESWERLLGLSVSQAARRDILRKALSFCGGDEELRIQWSGSLSTLGKDREAAEYLAEGLQACPYDCGFAMDVAEEWRRGGFVEEARVTLENARKTAPENPDVLAELATQELYAGNPGGAVQHWREILRIKPNAPEIKDRLAELDEGRALDRGFFEAYDVDYSSLRLPRQEEYPIDNVVTMLKQEVVNVNPNGTSSKMVHEVSKLLRPGGRGNLQIHRVYYDPSRQVVDILKASVITPDGRELARAQVSDRTVSAAMGVETKIYDEHYLKEIYFQDVEVGTIVDFQYVIRDTGGNIYGDYFADVFYMGEQHPVMKSQYILDLPKSKTFQTKNFRADVVPERLPSKDPGREIFKWEAKDLNGIEAQKAMPPAIDMIPFVQTTTMKTWNEVGSWYWNLSKDTIQTPEDLKKLVAEITAQAQTDSEKLRAIHDWVIQKIRYLGIEFGRNGYKPHRSTQSFRALYGDCKDTSVLITAMLKCVGIESRLVLVRTVDAGKVEPQSLPAPNLFNHCIAYVPNVEGKDYWIDCTTDFHQLGEVPAMDQGAQVLVVGEDGGQFVQIPYGTAEENRVEQRIEATLKGDGAGTVSLRDVRRGQEAPSYRQLAATPGKFKTFLEGLGSARFPGARMTRHANADSREKGAFWMEAEYAVPALASQSGDRFALMTCYDPLDLSRNYLSSGERKHDFELWFPRARTSEINYHLGDGFEVANLPESVELKNSFGSFKREVSAEGTIIRIRDNFTLSAQRIPKEDYTKFDEFCRKVDELLARKILVKKK